MNIQIEGLLTCEEHRFTQNINKVIEM